MALPNIGADERLAQRKGIKGVIFGRSGIGKTSLLWTLNASTTLFLDLEAGEGPRRPDPFPLPLEARAVLHGLAPSEPPAEGGRGNAALDLGDAQLRQGRAA